MSPAALAKTPPSFVSTEPDPVDLRFQKAAIKLDTKIVAKIRNMSLDFVELGAMCNEMTAKGYYRALGFNTKTAYFKDRFPDKGKSQLFEAMRIERVLTSGEDPVVSKEDVLAMPQENASAIVRMHKAGVTITEQIVTQAKELPISKFQSEVVFKENPKEAAHAAAETGDLPAGTGVGQTLTKHKHYELLLDTVSSLARSEEIARYVVRDDRREIPFVDKFLQAMSADFQASYAAEYEEWKANEEAEGAHAEAVEKSELALRPPSQLDPEDDAEILDAEYIDEEDHGVPCPECKGTKENPPGAPCENCDGKGFFPRTGSSLKG